MNNIDINYLAEHGHIRPEGVTEPDEIIVELKLPVEVSVFCAISDALGKTHGPDLYTRQVGGHLQIFRP